MIFVECDNTFFPNNVSPNQHALCIIFIKNFTVCTMLRKISMFCEASLLRILLCVPCFVRLACFVENHQQDQHLLVYFTRFAIFNQSFQNDLSALCSLLSKTSMLCSAHLGRLACFFQHVQKDQHALYSTFFRISNAFYGLGIIRYLQKEQHFQHF